MSYTTERVMALLHHFEPSWVYARPIAVADLKSGAAPYQGTTTRLLFGELALAEVEARLGVVLPHRRPYFGERLAACEALMCKFTPNGLIWHLDRGPCEFVRLSSPTKALVRFPDDAREHVADFMKLVPMEKGMKNFKTVTTDALTTLTRDQVGLSKIDNEVRRLGIGYVLATQATKVKDSAKAKLRKLGIIPAEFSEDSIKVLLNNRNFVLHAQTSKAAMRLTVTALEAALDAESRVTGPMRARILAAAKELSKPATTFQIEQR